jgi:hypothetical protein
MNKYTMAVSGQRLGKHVPISRQQILNNITGGLQQSKSVFSTWSVQRCYISKGKSQFSQFCMVVCEEATLAVGKGIDTVGAVTRKRLVTD